MKKIIISALTIVITLGLTACDLKNSKSANEDSTINSEQSQAGTFGDLKTVPQFKVKDINDNEVTSDVFKDKKVTMINIWGTFCGPCVEEMPILEELYKENETKGFNLIGVVCDAKTNEVQALQILKKYNIDFINLIPDEKFQNDFVSKTKIVPVSVFVDSEGEILETIVGSKSKEEYKKIIEKNLEQIK